MILELLTFVTMQSIGVVQHPPTLNESLRCSGYWSATLQSASAQLTDEEEAALSSAYDDIKATVMVIVASELDQPDWRPALDDARAAAFNEARRAQSSEPARLAFLRSRAEACRAAIMADQPR